MISHKFNNFCTGPEVRTGSDLHAVCGTARALDRFQFLPEIVAV